MRIPEEYLILTPQEETILMACELEKWNYIRYGEMKDEY